ncbi:MAG: phospholipase D family protein [Lentisphaerae bacterium]|nr:phospholipase D family protein [Lentisphaerota bacterium]
MERSPFGRFVSGAGVADRPALRGDTTKGNRVLIVNNGNDALLLRIHLIRQATKSIDIQTFIWTNDECGRLLMYELIAAARRGVRVRIIADHFVSDKDPGVVAFLSTVSPNLQVKHYRPAAKRIKPKPHQVLLQAAFRFRDFNQRMHNKIVLVDEAVAITGGRNIENSYYNYSTGMTFKDRDVLVMGPVLRDVQTSFVTFWDCRYAISSLELRDVAKLVADGDFARYSSRADFALNGLFKELLSQVGDSVLIDERFAARMIDADRVQFLADRPGKNRSLWLRGGGRASKALGKLIAGAQRELIIQSPYFVVNEKAEKVFRELRASRPDLKVTVSTNSFGSTDNTVAYSANYRLRSLYIESLGIHAYEYKPYPGDLRCVFPAYDEFERRASMRRKSETGPDKPFLCIHAKSFVMDERVSFIGSFNLDPRSVNLNTEVGFLITDIDVARALRRDILTDTAPRNSWVINRKQMPLGLEEANALFEGFVRKTPLDLWPVRNTSSFELREGQAPVPPDHPDFYDRYRDIGPFPGAESGLTPKQITTRVYKAVLGVGIPLF